MNETAVLKRSADRAKSILVEAEALLQSPFIASDSRIKDALAELRQAAKRVADNALAPVRIGILGEFSAGKSLLIGSLIGYADALPISELPTTGNVTAVNITETDELQTTRVGPYRIHFLDHAGFRECLGFMLNEARKRAATANLRPDLIEQLKAVNADAQDALSRIEVWASAAWKSTNNPSLRFLIRELAGFTRAYAMCGAGLCTSDEPIEVSAEVVRHALSLPIIREGIQKLEFEQIPRPSAPISSRPSSLTAQQLKDAFALIRMVSVDVTISRYIWDLTGLTGTDRFCLMDFPGLGSEASGVRDLYLCLRELEQIQTILILLNGRRPGGSEGSRLYDLLQEHRPGQDIRDMILVSVGRFDELPLQNDGLEETLRELAGSSQTKTTQAIPKPFFPTDEPGQAFDSPTLGNGALSVDIVLHRLPVLATCLAGAESIATAGRPDRITLVSPMFHLRFLQNKNPGLSCGSSDFFANNQLAMEKAAEITALWGKLAERLDSTTPSRSHPRLVPWLKDFAADGGIGQLRQVIVKHVKSHGITQRYKDIAQQEEQLRKSLRALHELLPTEPSQEPYDLDALQVLERELRNLAAFYSDLGSHLTLDSQFTIMRDEVSLSLADDLRTEIAWRVFQWPAWESLWLSVRNGFVSSKKPTISSIFSDIHNIFDVSETEPLPDNSDYFFDLFEKTLKGLFEYTIYLVDQGLRDWLIQLQTNVAASRALLLPLLERPSVDDIVSKSGVRGARGLMAALRASIDPLSLKKLLYPPEGKLSDVQWEIPATNATLLYPLARGDRFNTGKVFGWAQQFANAPEEARPPKHHSHQAMIVRIRDHLADAIYMEMVQVLSCVLDQVAATLAAVFQEISDRLSQIMMSQVMLQALAEPPAASPDGAPESEERAMVLSRLRYIVSLM